MPARSARSFRRPRSSLDDYVTRAGVTAGLVKSRSRVQTDRVVFRKWEGFCEAVGVPKLVQSLGVAERTRVGSAYLEYLWTEGGITSAKSLRVYFGAVERYHRLQNGEVQAPVFSDIPTVCDLRDGIARRLGLLNPVKAKPTLPLKDYVCLLRGFRESDPAELGLKLLCLILLVGGRRAGDVLPGSIHFNPLTDLCLDDVCVIECPGCEPFIGLSLPTTKTRRSGRRLRFVVSGGPFAEFDVVRLMKKFLSLRETGVALDRETPLFPRWSRILGGFTAIPLTTGDLRREVRARLARLTPKCQNLIGTHVYRLGAADILRAAGVPVLLVDRLLDWHVGVRSRYATDWDLSVIDVQEVIWKVIGEHR